ncbi:MAG TPA: NDP-sugar synthase [Acidimicrobiales bacterium]
MRAIVLLGGEGTRLRPLTYSLPKPMLPIAGKPMVAHTIEWLARSGVEEVVFSLGYRSDAFSEAFPDSTWAGVRLTYVVEPEPLDTAGAIRFAAHAAGATSERIIVCNGDVLTDLDLSGLLEFHERTGAEGTIHLTPVGDPSAFGVVPTSEDGRVIAFIEKPAPGTEPTNLINAGTYVLEASAIARVADGRRVSIERETFPAMVADGGLFAKADSAYWIDIGTPATFLRAQFDILEGRRLDFALTPYAGGGSQIFGGEDARIEGEVIGPVLLGRKSSVEAGAVVTRSVLGDGVVVEAGARILNSVILDNTVVGTGANIDSSIVGAGTLIGRGATIRDSSIVGFNEEIGVDEVLDGARVPA